MSQDHSLNVQAIARKWAALPAAERDAFYRRAQQSGKTEDSRAKLIREIPLPDEIVATKDSEFEVVSGATFSIEGLIACSGVDLIESLAAAEESTVATGSKFIAKVMKKTQRATSWDKLSDNKIYSLHKRAVGFFLFCVENHSLPAHHFNLFNRTKTLWTSLSDDEKSAYVERGLRTKVDGGATLWEVVSPSKVQMRWRLLFLAIARTLNLQNYSDWYSVSRIQLDTLGGSSHPSCWVLSRLITYLFSLPILPAANIIKKHYKDSHVNAITDLMPEHDFQFWKFTKSPADYWDKAENRRRYFKWMAGLLGISDARDGLEAWYDITPGILAELDSGHMIKDYYKGDLRLALKVHYPEHQWLEWRFASVPRKFWRSPENRRAFFLWLQDKLKITTMDDWYQVAPAQVRARGGGGLLAKFYRDSLSVALKEIFPNHPWEEFRFKHVPPSYWESVDNQRAYFDWFMRVHELKTLDQWYSVKAADVPSRRVISKYRYSLFETLKTLYPYHPWDASKFTSSSRVTPAFPAWLQTGTQTAGSWTAGLSGEARDHASASIADMPAEAAALREKFISILQQLGRPSELESWYSVSRAQLAAVPGADSILNSYSDSLPIALSVAFPEHDWKPWMFLSTPDDFWLDVGNQLEFVKWLKSQLGLVSLHSLYKLTIQDIKDYGGGGLARQFGESVYDILRSAFPKHDWQPWKFSYVPKAVWATPNLPARFLSALGTKMKISSMEEWYQISAHEIEQNGGASLLEYYDSSVYETLSAAFPDHQWKSWRFSKVSNGFWRKLENQRGFFEDVSQELSIKTPEDWYQCTSAQLVARFGVETLFEQYPGPNELQQALEVAYPQHKWEPERFAVSAPSKVNGSNSKLPSGRLLEDEVEQEEADDEGETAVDEEDDPGVLRRKYVKTLGKLLGITSPAQWKKVTREQLKSAGEIAYLDSEGGLAQLLKEVYPAEDFENLVADRIKPGPPKPRAKATKRS